MAISAYNEEATSAASRNMFWLPGHMYTIISTRRLHKLNRAKTLVISLSFAVTNNLSHVSKFSICSGTESELGASNCKFMLELRY